MLDWLNREDIIPEKFDRTICNQTIQIIQKAELLKPEDHTCEHLFVQDPKPNVNSQFVELKLRQLNYKASILMIKDL